MKNDIPNEELDPAVVELCRAINAFSGIETKESCQGFVDGHRPGKPWNVYFGFEGAPSLEGYAAIEFLVWLRRDAQAVGFDVEVAVNSFVPDPNHVGDSLYFVFRCKNRHPTEFADFIREMRARDFRSPSVTGTISRTSN